MNTNTMMQFQNDVQMMANNLMTQAMCAEKGIDYNQLMQTAQMAHLQGILQQEEQRRIMKVVANHYGTQETTGFLGKIKQAVLGAEQSAPAVNPFMQQMMMQSMMPQTVQPVQPNIPAPQNTSVDPRVEQLEKEVAGIKNDVAEIKDLIGNLASSMITNSK